jgi:hypothetical protein
MISCASLGFFSQQCCLSAFLDAAEENSGFGGISSRHWALEDVIVCLKEYANAEEVSAGCRVDWMSASDLSCGIGVSETAEYWEKVQRTSVGPHVDLVLDKNGTGTCLARADTRPGITWLRSFVFTHFCGFPSLSFDLRLTILIDHE